MELLWIGLFALLCLGIGALLAACDRLVPSAPGGQPSEGA